MQIEQYGIETLKCYKLIVGNIFTQDACLQHS